MEEAKNMIMIDGCQITYQDCLQLQITQEKTSYEKYYEEIRKKDLLLQSYNLEDLYMFQNSSLSGESKSSDNQQNLQVYLQKQFSSLQQFNNIIDKNQEKLIYLDREYQTFMEGGDSSSLMNPKQEQQEHTPVEEEEESAGQMSDDSAKHQTSRNKNIYKNLGTGVKSYITENCVNDKIRQYNLNIKYKDYKKWKDDKLKLASRDHYLSLFTQDIIGETEEIIHYQFITLELIKEFLRDHAQNYINTSRVKDKQLHLNFIQPFYLALQNQSQFKQFWGFQTISYYSKVQ